MVELSVIIPSYNNLNNIFKCLDSVFNQNTSVVYEVIVVDSSDKDDYSKLSQKFPNLNLIKLKQRTYPGTARNIGVKIARGRLIAFTDSDCVVSSDWIERIVTEHRNRGRVLIGGAVRNGTPKNLIGIAEYILEFSDFIPQKNERLVRTIPTCNFSIEKGLLLQIGELRDVIKSSDLLFSNNVYEKGINVFFIPSIQISHLNRCDLKKYLRNQRDLGYGSCKVRKIAKLPGSFLAKSKWFLPLIIPIRTLTTFKKVLRTNLKYILLTILIYPFILLGLISYCVGFWQGFNTESD